jgi:hypothetical protein
VIFFWAFSDISSSHMMPKLIGIEKRYSTAGVTVIGVHSSKYEHEKHKANIRHAIEEQSLPFNVVNDNSCQIRPTVLIFGPDALPLFIFEGENHVQHIEAFLLPVLAYYKSSVRASPSSSSVMKTSPEDLVATTSSKNFLWRK